MFWAEEETRSLTGWRGRRWVGGEGVRHRETQPGHRALISDTYQTYTPPATPL